jgi:hypothetical protein
MFELIKKSKQFIEIYELIAKLDADGNGRPDWQDYLILAGKLARLLDGVKDILAEIEELFGDNIEQVKEKLGIKDLPEVKALEAKQQEEGGIA